MNTARLKFAFLAVVGSFLVACGGDPELSFRSDGAGGIPGTMPDAGTTDTPDSGIVVGPEDGGTMTPDGGTPEPSCGDGNRDDGEECDDGNVSAGDGCDAECKIEEGFSCDSDGKNCYQCGNGVVEGAEKCDDLRDLSR